MNFIEVLALMCAGGVFGIVSAAILVSAARALVDYIVDRM